MKSPWYCPDGREIFNLNRYSKLKVFYQLPNKGRCFISGLITGSDNEWEDIVQGEKPDIQKHWETIKEILLS